MILDMEINLDKWEPKTLIRKWLVRCTKFEKTKLKSMYVIRWLKDGLVQGWWCEIQRLTLGDPIWQDHKTIKWMEVSGVHKLLIESNIQNSRIYLDNVRLGFRI